MPVLTWNTVTVGLADTDHVIAARGDVWLIVDRNGAVLRSTNKGATWSALSPVDSDVIAIYGLVTLGTDWVVAVMTMSAGTRAYVSDDDGASWTDASEIEIAYKRLASNGSTVFYPTYSSQIYRSSDAVTWDALTLPGSGYADLVAVGGGTLLAAQSNEWGEVFRSTDGGDTWSYAAAPSPEAVSAIAYLPISDRWVFSSRDGVRFSDDGGATWGAPVNAGLPTFSGGYYVVQFAEVEECVLAYVLFATTASQRGVYLLPAGGSTWAAEQTSADDNYGAVLFANADRAAFWTGATGAGEYRFASLTAPNGLHAFAPDPLAVVRARAVIDWTSGLDLSRLAASYILTVSADGFEPVQIPISSWQATANEGERASYVQAVIPAASDWLDALGARQGGTLTINMGYRLDDGRVRYDEIATASFGEFRYDRGPRNATATVSGYAYLSQSESGARTLRNVQTLSQQGGKLRVTCSLDMMLKPGMTATVGDESFVVGYINYYANRTGAFCQVGER